MASKVAPSIPKSQPHMKRACLCSPTTHPGSFRCSLHKRKPHRTLPRNSHLFHSSSMPSKPHSLKPFLQQVIIKPSSQDLHRRKNFHPKPSRFSLMNGNNDAVPVS
ncbi:hypothetical protein V8G54_006012 [Vigna mungo]|uniref:Serine-rich protein-like protein n=1 Tax=Vigna mungo TaxID=3915 RepID=A0AAQ3NZ60_VIGMU